MSTEPESTDAFLQTGSKRVVLVVGVLLLLGAAYPVARYFYDQALVSRENEDASAPVYTAEDVTFGGVDFGALHDSLLPEWFVAVGQAQRSPDGELSARQLVLDALASEPTLHAIVDELATARSTRPLPEALIRERQLVDEWNAWLRDRDVPFSLQLPINSRQRAANLWALSYFVLDDFEINLGGREIPARLLTRVDDLGVVEGYSGHAGESTEVAFVLIDKVAELGADRLWPVLDPALDPRLPRFHAAFADAVRAELAAVLPEEHLRTLRETAAARADLVWARDTINERRECGSWFSIRWVPMRGFDPDDLEEWRGVATSAGSSICPALTFGELEVMRDASWTLSHTAGIRDAVHALTAAVTRSVVVHEVRHVLDFDEDLVCRDCARWVTDGAAAEASAFLASIATGTAPASTLFELCELFHNTRGRGAHRRAAQLLIDNLLDGGCEAGPPADLVARAQALERSRFDHSSDLGLTWDFPTALRSRRFP